MSHHTETTGFRRLRQARRACRGMALPTALMVLIVLTLLGTAAVFTSSTELQIAGNGRTDLHALSTAEAGIHEAFARLNISTAHATKITPGEAGTPPVPVATWSQTIVDKAVLSAGETQTLTGAHGSGTTLPVTTAIGYKIESADETPPRCKGACDGEVVRFHTSFGYGGPDVPNSAAPGPAVLQITATYADASGAQRILLVDSTRQTSIMKTPGALRACGGVACSGSNTTPRVDGSLHPDLNGITAGGAVGAGCNDDRVEPNPSTNPNAAVGGAACPTDLFSSTFGMTKQELKAMADYIIPGPANTGGGGTMVPSGTKGAIVWITGTGTSTWNSNPTFGTEAEPLIVVSEGSIEMSGNVTCYCIVYAMGNFTQGTGSMELHGAGITEGTASLTGSGTIKYNPNVFTNLAKYLPYTAIVWNSN